MTHKEKWWSGMIAKYGSEEAVRQALGTAGAVGGKNRNRNKGFGSNPSLAAEQGKKRKK